MGLESVSDPQTLAKTFAVVGPERAIFSLDLKAGQPMNPARAWRNFSAEQIAATAIEIGFSRLIVLDLARVGVGQGVGVETHCQTLR